MLLLDAAHHHAEMPCLADNTDTAGLHKLLQCFRYLLGQPFLNLKTTSEDIDDTRQLAQSDDLFIRQIRDVHFPEKRQQVVLAKAKKLDVFDDYHLIVFHFEQSTIHD